MAQWPQGQVQTSGYGSCLPLGPQCIPPELSGSRMMSHSVPSTNRAICTIYLLAEVVPYTWNFLLFPPLFFWLIPIHSLRFSSRIPPCSKSPLTLPVGWGQVPLHKHLVIPYVPLGPHKPHWLTICCTHLPPFGKDNASVQQHSWHTVGT